MLHVPCLESEEHFNERGCQAGLCGIRIPNSADLVAYGIWAVLMCAAFSIGYGL